MIRQLLRPANIVTSMGLLFGVYSIVLSAGAAVDDRRAFLYAAIAILAATIFDSVDGRIARLTGGGSDFGSQLDSLVDLVAFGVAPGVLLYKWSQESLGALGFVAAFAFILAGAFRLARFNVRIVQGRKGEHSEGLPITFCGGMVAMLVIYHHQAGSAALGIHVAVVCVAVLLSYLMLSNIRFPVFKQITPNAPTLALLFSILVSILLLAVFYHLSFFFVLVGVAYVTWGLGAEVLVHGPRRRADDFMYLGSLDQSDDDLDDEDEADLPDLIEELDPERRRFGRRLLGLFRRR
jgi:CDP-diacylglycerol--serine O-phosphatidyltransferase